MLHRFIFFICLMPAYLFAQDNTKHKTDITGLWKGNLYNDTTQKTLNYEIAISEENGKLTGFSYTIFDIDGKKEIGIKKIKIKQIDDVITIEDIQLVWNNYSQRAPKGIGQQSILTLTFTDTSLQLNGKWSTNRTKLYRSLTGTLFLEKVLDYKTMVLYKKLVDLSLAQNLSFIKSDKKLETDPVTNSLASVPEKVSTKVLSPAIKIQPIVVAAADFLARKSNSVQSIFFESDSLMLTLYDNGDVDGDTVSVLMNGKIIFAKQGLTTKASSKTIYVGREMSDSISLIMYAENLGSIPPNTGLLIIMDGEKRYEVRFSADLKTNAAIVLKRRKKAA